MVSISHQHQELRNEKAIGKTTLCPDRSNTSATLATRREPPTLVMQHVSIANLSINPMNSVCFAGKETGIERGITSS